MAGFSEDFSLAMQGVTKGVNQTVQKRQLLEDADKQRKALEVERAESERKAAFNASVEDFQRDAIESDAIISRTQAKMAEGTVDSDIDTTLINNEATQANAELSAATDQTRLKSGAAKQVSDSEQTARETANAQNDYIQEDIKERMAAGVPKAQATQEANDSWTKVKKNEKDRAEYQTTIDQVETDRLNGVPAEKAFTAKVLAVAERRQAEMLSERTKLMQNGNYVADQFARDNADNFMEMGRAAIAVAYAGDTKQALKLIDSADADGDGVGDMVQAGAVDTKLVKKSDGTYALAAIDANNQVVKDQDGDPAILPESALKKYFDEKARNGKVEKATVPRVTAASVAAARLAAGLPAKPMDIKDFNMVSDTVDSIVGEKWGLGTVRANGTVDNNNLDLGNALPDGDLDGPIYSREIILDDNGRIESKGKKKMVEPSGVTFYENTLNQLEADMSTKLAVASGTGQLETLAPKYGTLPNAVQATYSQYIEPVTFRAAIARGAQRAAVLNQLAGQDRETFMQSVMNSFGDRDLYPALPEDVKKFVNAEVLKLAADVQSEQAIISRADDPTVE